MLDRYSAKASFFFVSMAFFPGLQFAGQTSPNSSVNWNALTKRSVSSTSLPTGMSLTVTWRIFCFPSRMKRPRKAQPSSDLRMPYDLVIS